MRLSHRSLPAAFAFAIGGLLGLPLTAQTTVTGPVTYPAGQTTVTAPTTITTSGSVTVGNGSDVTFSAGNSITLAPGFSALAGSVFHANVPQAPSVPTGFSVSYLTPSSFTLQWTPSTGGGGFYGTAYEVFKNNISIGITFVPSMAIAGLTQNTAYSMTVRALGVTGLWSGVNSPPYTVTTLIDSDGDGLPDSWELLYPAYGNPNAYGSTAGITNFLEYQLGFDPRVLHAFDVTGNPTTGLKVNRPQ